MKKTLSVLMAITMLLVQLFVPAFADDEIAVESITAEAQEVLIENWDGSWWTLDVPGNETEKRFVYDATLADPYFVITMEDGTVIEGDSYDIMYETGCEINDITDYETDEWGVGVNTAKFEVMGEVVEFEVKVVETPVESATAVARFPLIEEYDGYWDSYYDENDNEVEYFNYYEDAAYPVFTITYKDGTVVEGDLYEIDDQTGAFPICLTRQAESPWEKGINTAIFSFLGYEFEVEVEVVPCNISNVTVEQTHPLIENHSGNKEYYYDENDEYVEYFWYDIFESDPVFTVEFDDGTTFTGTIEEISEFLNHTVFVISEQYPDVWTVGTNTATMELMGFEFTAEFEVVESHVAEVIITEENGLSLEVVYKDGSRTGLQKVVEFEPMFYYGDGSEGGLYTEADSFDAVLGIVSDEEDYAKGYYFTILGVDSNVIYNTKWIESWEKFAEVISGTLQYGVSAEDVYGNSFTGFDRASDELSVTDMVAISTYMLCWDIDEYDGYYRFVISTEEATDNIMNVFGVEVTDFSSVPGYDAESETIEVYSVVEMDYFVTAFDLSYEDGKWTKSYIVYNSEDLPIGQIEIVLDENLTVEKISYDVANFKLGDVTGDGKVTSLDARYVLQNIARLRDLSESQFKAADVNADNKINALDARWILQAAAEIRVL